MQIISKNLPETEKIAREFAKKILKQKRDKALVVGLYGDLGSGKTTFVQMLAKILGIKESITSPTFVILKNYRLLTANYLLLIHIDAYRLESGKELEKLGWKEISDNPENIILIEWPERVSEILPSDMIKINFEFVDENTRKIEL